MQGCVYMMHVLRTCESYNNPLKIIHMHAYRNTVVFGFSIGRIPPSLAFSFYTKQIDGWHRALCRAIQQLKMLKMNSALYLILCNDEFFSNKNQLN